MAYPIFTGCGRSRRRPILLETSSAKERHREGGMQKEARKTSQVQPRTPCKSRSDEQGCRKDDDCAVMQQYGKTAEQKQL